MRHAPATLALLLACAAPLAILAAAASDATRELELRVSDHPKKAEREAAAWLVEAERTKDGALEIRALRLQAMAFEQVEDNEGLRRVALRGAKLARDRGDRVAEVHFIAARGASAVLDGKYAEAARDYDEAARLAQASNLPGDLARVHVNRSHLALSMGQIPEALDAAMKAHAHFESARDPFGQAIALSALANVHGRDTASTEDLRRSAQLHQRSLDLLEPGVGRYDRSTDYFNLGTVHLRLKEYDKARSYYERSLEAAKDLEDPTGEAYVFHRLGTIEAALGRPKEALALQERALAVFRKTGDRGMELRTLLARSDALSHLAQRRESVDGLEQSRILLARLPSPRLEAMFHEAAAVIYARFGDYPKAYAETMALRESEKRRDDVARNERAAELQARFELKQKEAENALLRSRELESEARRLSLVLALILSLVVLGGLAAALGGFVMRHRRLAVLAARDDLTGIANRRSILAYLRQQRRESLRKGEALTVAVIDLDHFKRVNDDLGHVVGDHVLVAFAEVCTRQLRTQDRIGRFGGEEFLLVMPGAGIAHIPYVFERLRRALQDVAIEGVPPGRAITFSLGAAEARGVGDDLESLIQRADRALYRAKQDGRDRYEIG